LVAWVGCAGNTASKAPVPPLRTPATLQAAPAMPNDARARELVDLLVKHQFSEAVGRFDATMRQALPPEKLQQVWLALAGQVGALQSVVGTRSETKDTYEIIHVTCRFENMALDARVVFDRAHLISGLFFVPAQAPPEDPERGTPPPYAKRDTFEEQEIQIGTRDWQLPGTLTVPLGAGPFPAAILVHGSGPHDRDETIGQTRPFRDLAWGLASRGIAVIRYDKRTKVHAAKLAGARDLTVRQEVVDDAIAAAAAARATAKVDPRRVFIVGHSLGGTLAPRILGGDDAIAGAILLAGSARPLEDLILEQLTYLARLDGTVSKEEAARLEQVQVDLARLGDPSFSAASPPVFGVPASYWIDLRKYDAVAAAKALTRPLFILQGGRDYQVTKADFELWKQGLRSKQNCSLRLYPDLNHLFVTGRGRSTPEEYGTEGHVAPEVVADIASWILTQPSR
jgi:hypothetical protein